MNFKVVTIIALLFQILTGTCESKNILCILGTASERADKWNQVLLKELDIKNHSLTIITATKWPTIGFRNSEIVELEITPRFLEYHSERVSSNDLLKQSTWRFITNWYDRQMLICHTNMESMGFSRALNLAVKEKRQYDLIVYDITYGMGCLLHLAYLFEDIPIIGITSGHLNGQNMDLYKDSIINPALDPYILSDFGSAMNYWKRIQNVGLYVFDYLYRKWIVEPAIDDMWFQSTHTENTNIIIPNNFDMLVPRFKAILANHHPTLHTLKALPINVIPVPGLHIQETKKSSLNSNILKFIKKTKSDVILIGLDEKVVGSENVQKLLNIIKLHPDNGFVWINFGEQFTEKVIPNNLELAPNVKAVDILALKKVKCSIILPEILAIQESFYNAVPAITVTTSPEQRYIVQRLLEHDLIINMELDQFEHHHLLQQNLQKCLNNKSLRKRVQQFQYSLKQRQNPSLATAIWWLEHIMENPQANDDLLASLKERPNFLILRSLDIIAVVQILLVLCAINTIFVMRQTILNLKNMSKRSKKKGEKLHKN